MKYTKEKLLYIARQVIKQHPGIAEHILSGFGAAKKVWTNEELIKINPYFVNYCALVRMDPENLKPFSRYESEHKKIFVCAIFKIYGEVYGINKLIEAAAGVKQNVHYRIKNEVKFRYDRDGEFKNNVDLLIKNIKNEFKTA